MARQPRSLLLWLGIALVVLLADQFTKLLIIGTFWVSFHFILGANSSARPAPAPAATAQAGGASASAISM